MIPIFGASSFCRRAALNKKEALCDAKMGGAMGGALR